MASDASDSIFADAPPCPTPVSKILSTATSFVMVVSVPSAATPARSTTSFADRFEFSLIAPCGRVLRIVATEADFVLDLDSKSLSVSTDLEFKVVDEP